MLYSMKTTEATVAVPRVVDAHGLLHMRASKSAKACDAADAVDGFAVVQNPTLRLAATAWGVSIGSVARALRLTPTQRDAVRRGQRPLILPRAPAAPPAVPVQPPVPSTTPTTPPAVPVVMSARERLDALVGELGLNTVLDLLAASEKVAA
jgi:hypothetical protein